MINNILAGPYKPSDAVVLGMSRMQTKVPFMYRLPEFKETFVASKFPGNFDELVKKYRTMGIVKELSQVFAKRICILHAIDESKNCYLSLLGSDDPNAPPPVIFQVTQPKLNST